ISEDSVCGSGFYLRMAQLSVNTTSKQTTEGRAEVIEKFTYPYSREFPSFHVEFEFSFHITPIDNDSYHGKTNCGGITPRKIMRVVSYVSKENITCRSVVLITVPCHLISLQLPGSGGSDPSLEPGFLNQMRSRCNNSGDLHEEPGMNTDYEGTTRSGFGTHYYKRLVEGKGILHVDQQLMASEATASWV
ncbi:hypothetical protein IFM89_004949, partial [Coptis chinensis]